LRRLVPVARHGVAAGVLGASAGHRGGGALADAAAPRLVQGAVEGGEADHLPRLGAEGAVAGRLEMGAGQRRGGRGEEERAHGHAFRVPTISSLVKLWPSVRKRTVSMRDSWPGTSVRMSA